MIAHCFRQRMKCDVQHGDICVRQMSTARTNTDTTLPELTERFPVVVQPPVLTTVCNPQVVTARLGPCTSHGSLVPSPAPRCVRSVNGATPQTSLAGTCPRHTCPTSSMPPTPLRLTPSWKLAGSCLWRRQCSSGSEEHGQATSKNIGRPRSQAQPLLEQKQGGDNLGATICGLL